MLLGKGCPRNRYTGVKVMWLFQAPISQFRLSWRERRFFSSFSSDHKATIIRKLVNKYTPNFSRLVMFVPRSPDDVYPPLRIEEQDDYLLSNLDMDFSNISVIPPVSHVNDAVKFKNCKKSKR